MARKGIKLSKEHKKKLSLAKIGYTPSAAGWNKGIKPSKEQIKRQHKIINIIKGGEVSP